MLKPKSSVLPSVRPGFDAAAGQPHREGLRMMVAAHAPARFLVRLHHRRAAEFAAPDHQRVFQQAALLSNP